MCEGEEHDCFFLSWQIENANVDHAGSYLCCVTNVNGESWTEAAEVEVGKRCFESLVFD